MRQSDREKWWSGLRYLGADGLAAYLALLKVIAEICGIAHLSCDQLAIAMMWESQAGGHRRLQPGRARKALEALARPVGGPPVIVWDEIVGLVYVLNWDSVGIKASQFSHVDKRREELLLLPDCEPKRVALAELAPLIEEFDPDASPEVQVKREYRKRLPHAQMPDRDKMAPGAPLRTAIAAAWANRSDMKWWSTYFGAVAARTDQGARPLRVKGESLAVTMETLLRHEVAKAVRQNPQREAASGSTQTA